MPTGTSTMAPVLLTTSPWGYIVNTKTNSHIFEDWTHLLDELVVTEDDNTNVVGLQVEGHAFQSRAKFHHFLCLDILEAIDTGDTVSNGQDAAGLLQIDGGGGAQDSLLEDGGDLPSSSLGGINLLGGGELTGGD